MARVPLRHIPLFWLGLLPVMIILWAWTDSIRYRSSWRHCDTPGRNFRIILHDSALQLSWKKVLALAPPLSSPTFSIIARSGTLPRTSSFIAAGAEWQGVDITPSWGEFYRGAERPLPPPASVSLFPGPCSASSGEFSRAGDIEYQHVEIRVIPLWLVLLAWLPLWLGATVWQGRRKLRKLRELEVLPAK